MCCRTPRPGTGHNQDVSCSLAYTAYVLNDPVNAVDPEGLLGWDTVFRFIVTQTAKFGLNKVMGELGLTEQSKVERGAIREQNFLKMQAALAFEKCMQKCRKTPQNECNKDDQQPFLRQDTECVNQCLANLNIAMENL